MPNYTPTKLEDHAVNLEPLKPGTYWVKIDNAEDAMSASKSEMIKLTCSVVGHSKMLFERLVFTEKCFWKITEARAALGFDDKVDEDTPIEASEFIGKEALVRVKVREYEGKLDNEIVHWFTPNEIEAAKKKANLGDDDNTSEKVRAEF